MASIADELKRIAPMGGNSGEAPMLPRECYTSAEFFAFEREAVFARSWICVGRVEQIADSGDYLAASVAGERILMARTKAGEIRAISAVCQHRGEVIVGASGHARSFRCPLHFRSYDLEGRLIGAPRMPRDEHVRRSVRLPAVRHAVRFPRTRCGTARRGREGVGAGRAREPRHACGQAPALHAEGLACTSRNHPAPVQCPAARQIQGRAA